MNREKAKEFLPLIQAFAEGEVIQIWWNGAWSDISDPEWTGYLEDYRVKPKAREWWFSPTNCWGCTKEEVIKTFPHLTFEELVEKNGLILVHEVLKD